MAIDYMRILLVYQTQISSLAELPIHAFRLEPWNPMAHRPFGVSVVARNTMVFDREF